MRRNVRLLKSPFCYINLVMLKHIASFIYCFCIFRKKGYEISTLHLLIKTRRLHPKRKLLRRQSTSRKPVLPERVSKCTFYSPAFYGIRFYNRDIIYVMLFFLVFGSSDVSYRLSVSEMICVSGVFFVTIPIGVFFVRL